MSVVQTHLREHRSERALVSFLQACNLSIFSLAVTAEFKHKLVKVIEEAEDRANSWFLFEPDSKLYA